MILWKDTYSVSFVCLLVSSSLLALSIFIQPPPPPLLPSRYMSAEPFPASQAVHAKKTALPCAWAGQPQALLNHSFRQCLSWLTMRFFMLKIMVYFAPRDKP